MKIGLAQIQTIPGDIKNNIEKHILIVKQAVKFNLNAVFFPELSVTGYEPKLAKQLSLKTCDSRLKIFSQYSNSCNITIGVGIPIQSKSKLKPNIGLFITSPSLPPYVYTKQILHIDEQHYFSAYKKHPKYILTKHKIGLGICYEALQKSHVEEIVGHGVDLIIASVAKHDIGVEKAGTKLSHYAKKYAVPILMVNSVGPCDNFLAAGRSSVWNKHGEKTGELDSFSEGILVYDFKSGCVNQLNIE